MCQNMVLLQEQEEQRSRGAEEQRPAGSGSALDSVTSHLPTKSVMKDVKCKNGEGGGLFLKGFHPGNRKDIIS